MDVKFADTITLLNLAAGILSLYAAARGEIILAASLIAAGMVFDFLDGRVARLMQQSHPLGRELDSLADLVTFGVAPGAVALAMNDSAVMLFATVIYGFAAAYRLARFNIERQKHFRGLPSPAAAALVLTATLLFPLTPWTRWATPLVFLCVAGLMAATFTVKKP